MSKRKGSTKFTVVIPTRERCDTLEHSLRTVTTQDYDNLEIIVSDNFSQDGTRDVVESFKDSRIRYINTGKRVSMSHNWEFALSHVNDGYVMFLGDDDGLLPGALGEVDDLINAYCSQAIVSYLRYHPSAATFFWPSFADVELQNILIVSVGTDLMWRHSDTVLADVLNFHCNYNELPTIYCNFVSYDAIRRATPPSGRFFHSMTPDVYSAIALGCVIDTYHYTPKPYALAGLSQHSIGQASSNSGFEHPTVKRYLSENNIPFHDSLVMAPSIPILLAECVFQARERLPAARHLQIDLRKVLQKAVDEIIGANSIRYDAVLGAVREIAVQHGLADMLRNLNRPYAGRCQHVPRVVKGLNMKNRSICLDCSEFGVQNIYDASILCKHVMTLYQHGYLSPLGIINTTAKLFKRKLEQKKHRLKEQISPLKDYKEDAGVERAKTPYDQGTLS